MKQNNSSMKSLMAHEKIRDMIFSGAKLPGTRLIISDLEQELGIGRGPIREALMRLDRSGLIKNIPYKGAVVATPPTWNEILHIFKMRVDLEIILAEEALKHLTDEQLAEIERLNKEMCDYSPEFYSLDRQFHNIIYEASGLSYLCMIVQKLIFPIETFLNIYRQEETDCIKFNSEHTDIVNALKEKDSEKLKAALTQNINSGLELIEKTYKAMIRIPR